MDVFKNMRKETENQVKIFFQLGSLPARIYNLKSFYSFNLFKTSGSRLDVATVSSTERHPPPSIQPLYRLIFTVYAKMFLP